MLHLKEDDSPQVTEDEAHLACARCLLEIGEETTAGQVVMTVLQKDQNNFEGA